MGTFHQLMTVAMSAPDTVFAYELPNQDVKAPPFMGNVTMLVGWLKWGALIAGVIGLIVCAVMMMIGRRGRSQTAVEGASGIPWVLAGLTLVAFSTALVNQFF
jgi:hypothetical protein